MTGGSTVGAAHGAVPALPSVEARARARREAGAVHRAAAGAAAHAAVLALPAGRAEAAAVDAPTQGGEEGGDW
eukprot:scaffold122159_cov63-Phaeocystis_antarctica.AAC.1